METQRIFTTIAALLATAVAQADLVMLSGINKRHYQISPVKLTFDSGEFEIFLRDGITILAPCAYDPLLQYLPPVIGCPLGTTGFIAAGDIDRDGRRDDNSYWSVLTVVPAVIIEPSRPELAALVAGPPSKLPRPLSNFRDDSAITFYNISEPETFRAYNQTRYELIRRYGSIRQVETAFALGTVTTPISGDINRDGEVVAPEIEPPALGAIVVVVTGADIVGSPLTITVPVLGPERAETAQDDTPGDGPEAWAAKVRIALAANPAISDFYTVLGEGNAIVLTDRDQSGNDSTLNVSLAPAVGTTLSLLPSLVSANTVTGVDAGGSPEAALKQMNEELITGQYVVNFPRLGRPEGIPVALPVTIVPNLEAVNPAARVRTGFRFTTGLWDGEYYQMDPRLATSVRWTGNDRTVIRGGDFIHFSILNEAEDFLEFPPTVPQSPIIFAPNTQHYALPPFFFEIGQEAVLRLTYDRLLATSGASYDSSVRDFRAKLRMVDSYAGYAATTMPLGTRRQDLLPTGDIDRDGMKNIDEFALQFPTYDAINTAARDQFVPNPTGIIDPGILFGDIIQNVVQVFSHVSGDVEHPILDPAVQPPLPGPPVLDGDGHLVFTVPTRPQTGTTLKYVLGVVAPGKTKPTPVRMAGVWEMTKEVTATTIQAFVVVDLIGEITGSVWATDQPHMNSGPPFYTPTPALEPITVNRDTLIFRTIAPWPVGKVLPDLRVIVTAVPVK